MVLSIVDSLRRIYNDINNYIDRYYNEPFFWIIIFLVLFAVSMYAISKYAEK